MKKAILLLGLGVVVTAFAATSEFDGITEIVTDADSSARSSFKIAISWALSLVIPMVMIFFGMGHAYYHLKQKSEQHPSTGKMIGTLAGGAIIYAFIYVFAVAILSRIMTGNVATWFNTINQFWLDISQ